MSGSPKGGQLGDASSVNFPNLGGSSSLQVTVKSRVNDLIGNCATVDNNPGVVLTTTATVGVRGTSGGIFKSTRIAVDCGKQK